MAFTTVRWGIIGCGDVTEVKSGPAFQNVEGGELTAVMRRDAAKAEDYARRHGVERWYDDADALIADPNVDAVYVATPPGSHEFYAHKVCASRKPCYVEKPMARNASEAQRMVDAFTAADLPLYVAYYRRALPRFVEAKDILASGLLGDLRSVSYSFRNGEMRQALDPVPWRLQPEHAGAGLFLDLGSHALDLLDFLLGPLTLRSGEAANKSGNYAVEDSVDLTFESAGSVNGVCHWDFASEERADEFRFTGDEGELRMSCFGNEPLFMILDSGNFKRVDLPNPPHVQEPLIRSIVDDLRAGGQTSPSTGTTALRTQILMDQSLSGYYGGREDGFWQRR